MRKVFLFAVAAAALVACSNDELNVQENVLSTSKEAPVNFDVYAQRGLTRGGGQAGDLTNANIGGNGFGVFAYYIAGEQYDAKATPNFMYNQQVTCQGTATPQTLWTYEPVKYWPNEYGDLAISDEVDYLTFFAYAPWTEVEPTTGNIVPKEVTQQQTETVEHQQKYNIISVNKNTATGDPIVKYVVDTDPKTSVDLLWGVAAETAGDNYTPIDNQNGNVSIKAGLPFLSLVKPNNPQSDRLQFNLKHALAKVKVTIDYIADDFTPNGTNGATIDATKTRIYVRSFKMSGFATKGALNLNNTTAGQPLWKDFDGAKDLSFDDVTFQDGRKDGKEGETNGAQNNETPQGLNPAIIENNSPAANGTFGPDKTTGVTNVAQNLFGGDETANGGFFYVIPRNEEGNKVDVTIAYDVETIDPNLAGKLSDNETHGISIENIISKENIFGGLDFMAGYQYEINIHLGMTSVKVEATVTDWVDNGKTNVDLPDNQQKAAVTAANYEYPDGYTYTGTLYASENDVVYVPGSTDNEDIMNDFARFVGALHRAAGVAEIEYNSVKYTWDPALVKANGYITDPDQSELKGSNWIDPLTGNTLVKVVTANATALQTAGVLTLEADGEPVNFYLGTATNSFKSYGLQQTTYVEWGEGTVFVFNDAVTIGQNQYKKVLVLTNTPDASFVGKVYYVDENAAVANDPTQPGPNDYWQLYDQFGNPLGIYVVITAAP
ncbi:MAG: hypothetical protein J6T05_00010 [Prevotella sp.]|nr:hypothetical protein [Prevotella sp.]